MSTTSVDAVAKEFQRLIHEGWTPRPSEFLHRVPDDERDECRRRLEAIAAEIADVGETTTAPAPEPQALRKLSREEARAMFRELDARRAARAS